MLVISGLLVTLLSLCLPATPQVVRDAAPKPSTGTAVLAGTLVTDDTPNRPVRRAVMSLTIVDSRTPRMTVTDDDGRFVFPELPAGSFTLTAAKPGFVTAYYGGKRPGRGPGVPIVVPDGRRMTVAMKILKGAVIAGTVRDELGRPAAGAGFQLMQYRMTGSEKTLAGAYGGFGYTSTDDRGMYRAFGLPPGDYLVVATGRSFGNTAMREVTASDVQWAQQQFQNGAAPSASGATAATPTPALAAQLQPVVYAPVYFPGTVDAAEATPVTVAAGEERSGIDFTIRYVATARISGTVIDPEGRPALNGQVNLVATSQQPGDFVMAMSSASRTTVAGGRFSLSGIAPGRYAITVKSSGPAGAPGSAPSSGRGAAASPGPVVWALRDVVIDGHDVSDVAITLEPGLNVSGTLAFDGATAPPDPARVRLSLTSLQTASGLSINAPATPVNADGSFTISGLPPGRYRMAAAAVPGAPGASWTMRGAMVNGRDVADVPLEVRAGADVSGVAVTFSDRAAEITGTVLDQAGRPTPDYSIVVFTADRSQWLTGSRRIKATRLSNGGTFAVSGLPAGEYFVCAATDYDNADLSDPAFLQSLAAKAIRLTLADGEKRTLDLKVADGGK